MSRRGGSRLHGSRSHPCAHYIRFTEDEQDRILKLLRKRRLTMQAFAHAAIIRALNEATLGKKTDGEVEVEIEREQRDEREKSERPVASLGIRDRLQDDFADELERLHARRAAPTATTTTQAATPALAAAQSLDDEILTLARTIVNSPLTSRREMLKAAARALARRGRTPEESVRLAEDLDAAIQRIEGAPQTALDRVRARRVGQ